MIPAIYERFRHIHRRTARRCGDCARKPPVNFRGRTSSSWDVQGQSGVSCTPLFFLNSIPVTGSIRGECRGSVGTTPGGEVPCRSRDHHRGRAAYRITTSCNTGSCWQPGAPNYPHRRSTVPHWAVEAGSTPRRPATRIRYDPVQCQDILVHRSVVDVVPVTNPEALPVLSLVRRRRTRHGQKASPGQ